MSNKIEDEDEKEAGLNPAENEHVSPCSMHPNSYLFKGIGLLFICSIGFGSYFCYDCPGALEVQILILNNSYYNISRTILFSYTIMQSIIFIGGIRARDGHGNI